jgi:hypothetical protein
VRERAEGNGPHKKKKGKKGKGHGPTGKESGLVQF